MPKVIVYSVVGMVAGFVAIFAVCQFALTLPPFAEKIEAAQKRSPSDFDNWYEKNVSSKILVASFVGGLLSGGFCGLRAAKPLRHAVRRRRPVWTKDDHWPLSESEFARVMQACLFVQVERRNPAYVQGLVVGRLVESDPDLAKKVDDFSPEHMVALWRDLRRAAQIR